MTPRSFHDALLDIVPSLRAYARLLTGSQHRADDLVQDTLLKAWENRATLRDLGAVRAWAMRIMHNLRVRQARKLRREIEDVDDAMAARLAVDPAQHHALELLEVSEAFEFLTASEKEALFLVGIDNYSYEDAGRALGLAVGTVKSRVHRARSKLAADLAAECNEPARSAPARSSTPEHRIETAPAARNLPTHATPRPSRLTM